MRDAVRVFPHAERPTVEPRGEPFLRPDRVEPVADGPRRACELFDRTVGGFLRQLGRRQRPRFGELGVDGGVARCGRVAETMEDRVVLRRTQRSGQLRAPERSMPRLAHGTRRACAASGVRSIRLALGRPRPCRTEQVRAVEQRLAQPHLLRGFGAGRAGDLLHQTHCASMTLAGGHAAVALLAPGPRGEHS